MKGILFRHWSIVGFGRKRKVLTVVIKDCDNLAISIYTGISSHFGFEIDEDFENLGEIEIPEDLVVAAANFAKANDALLRVEEQFRLLMEG